MAVVVTDKRFIDKNGPIVTDTAASGTTEPGKTISLIVIRPETMRQCQSEAIRKWLYSVMPDQQAEGQSV